MSTRHLLTTALRAGRGVLLCAALVSLLAACSGKKGAAADPLKLVPGDSRMLLQVNVARLRQTQFKDRLLQIRDGSPELKKKWDTLVQKAGLDPLRDIDTMMVALPYQGQQGGGDAGALLYGRFKQAPLVAFFKEQSGVKEEKHGNHTLYTDDPASICLAFLNPTTAALGSKPWVKQVLDLADGKGQSARATPELVKLVDRVKGNQVMWAVVYVPDQARKLAKEADSPVKGVATMVATVDFAAGMDIDFRADCDNEAEAKSLTDKFNNLVQELQQSALLGGLGFGGMLSQVKGNQEGAVFHAHGSLQQQQLDDLMKKIEAAFKSKLGSGGMPRLQLPSAGQGGPATSGEDDKGAAKGGDAKAGPSGGDLPQLKLQLSPPGAAREKHRPSLLGK